MNYFVKRELLPHPKDFGIKASYLVIRDKTNRIIFKSNYAGTYDEIMLHWEGKTFYSPNHNKVYLEIKNGKM